MRWRGIETVEEEIGRYGEGHGGCWAALRRLRRRWGGIEKGEEGVGRPPAPPWPAVARRQPLRPESVRQASRPRDTQRPHVGRRRQDTRRGDEVNRISDGVSTNRRVVTRSTDRRVMRSPALMRLGFSLGRSED